jgi:hypothetical protein
MRNKEAKFSKRERGQSLTELAVSFTLLVIILAVTVDLGRMFFSLIAIREAAQEGAIYGSLNGDYSLDAISGRARNSSSAPVDLNSAAVTVAPQWIGDNCSGFTGGNPNSLRVTVTYAYTLTMPLVSTFIGTQTVPLSASATSIVLRPAC